MHTIVVLHTSYVLNADNFTAWFYVNLNKMLFFFSTDTGFKVLKIPVCHLKNENEIFELNSSLYL